MWPFKAKEKESDAKFRYVVSMDRTINWTEKDEKGKVSQTGNSSTIGFVLMENNLGERICKVSEPSDDYYVRKYYNFYNYKNLPEDEKTAYKNHELYKTIIFPWLNGGELDEPWASQAKDREKELRQKHPGLEELWEKYQAFLILCKEDKDFEED